MRTRPLVAAVALIAAVALVASAGPAASQAPGTPRTIEPLAVQRLGVDRPMGLATTIRTPDPDPGWTLAGSLAGTIALREPDVPPLLADRPSVVQVRSPLGAVAKSSPKPAWRRAEYSWYGRGFYGSGTACGQTYSKTILGVAHKTLPCGTKVTFRNPKNGRTITVRVIDRGPYVEGRMWDLSRATCKHLDNCYTSVIQYRVG